MLSAIFFISGIWKITAPAATIAYIASVRLPFPQLGLVIGTAVETIAVSTLVLGYRTRWVAALIAVYCLATSVFFHHNMGDQNQLLNFFKNIAIAGGLLQIVVFGAGRFSLDARPHHHAPSKSLQRDAASTMPTTYIHGYAC